MKKKLLFVICAVLIFQGCFENNSEKKSESEKPNVLRDYIETPKDKARAVKEGIETNQNQVDDVMSELDE